MLLASVQIIPKYSLSLQIELNKTNYYPTLLLEYKQRAKREQRSHDICTRLIPTGRVKLKNLAS